ncbi:helix-turn-helix domain-containing protein [Cytophagaceae bacterium YF14B1]|uniref:Helix-turn-helix domain-containing protein n=1 Tax=Xanthocytophaga flava TaxID=3048013 RepID=A0AAE3U838_9BACT|nr:helix-turn-helix domain-containing protein [Xanthocytophaga flavus]MDJ1483599.1 helix-turn-helix domain-containing protein [Xanthocytophaga flavus]
MFNPFEELQARLIRVETLLYDVLSIIAPAKALQEKERLGGIDLAIQVTGLAKSTIYNLASEGRIPHMKRGKKLYFSYTELENWIREGKPQLLHNLQSMPNYQPDELNRSLLPQPQNS